MNEKKKVILITIDSLRADHVSCLGYHRQTTPNMDRLAKEGFVFTQAIANAHNTSTSFPAILSSTYPLMYKDCTSHYFKKLSSSRIMIAEILKENGYTTAAFHSNPLLTQYYGYDRGFDTFQDLGSGKFQEDRTKTQKGKLKRKKNNVKSLIDKTVGKSRFLYKQAIKTHYILSDEKKILPYKRAETINKSVLSWLDGQKKISY